MAESSGVTRRSVLAVGAWSVPVLAVAVAAPVAAASGEAESPTLFWTPSSITVSQSQATLRVVIPAGWEGVGSSGYLVISSAPFYNVRTIRSSWAPRLSFPNSQQAYFPDRGESRLPSGSFDFVVDFPVWNPEDAALGSASAQLVHWNAATSTNVVVPAPGLPFTGA
ncbi:MAG: hypothetical protein Q7T71_10295 [Herbiconiux sp.]|nr:hypothetical protein [Herbiconiux sp.]